MKRILSLLLLCALLLSLLPAARAQETVTLTNPQWTDSGLSVAVQAGQTAALYAATYENGRMTQIKSVPNVTGSKTVTFPLDPAYTAKVFALDAAGRPLCENLTVENEDAVAFHADNLPVPAMDDTLAEALGLAISAYSSATLGLDRASAAVYAQTAEPEGTGTEGDANLSAAMPVATPLPARPASIADYPKKVPAAYVAQVQHAAAAASIANKSSASAGDSYDQVTKACAVLEAVAEAQMAQAQTRARALPLSLMAAGGRDNDLFWAQAISDLYDSYQGGMKIAQLAKDLGVDARRAYSMLTMAQNILQGHYSNEEGDLNEFWEKTMIATKAGAKVGLFVCATIATGGATAASPAGYVTMGEAAGIVVGGVDAALEVTTAGSKIILGSDHVAVKKFEEKTKPVSDALFLFGLFSFNSASAGEKLAFLGDLNERKNELYDNIKLKYNLDVDQITMDVLTMDPNDPMALRKLLDKYRKNDKTGMEEPTKTFEEVVEDFTELRPVTDEKLEELLDEAGVKDEDGNDKDLKDVVKDFDEKINEEVEKLPKPDPDDDDYTPPPAARIWRSYYDDGSLAQEEGYDSEGERAWSRFYNRETHALASESYFSTRGDGQRIEHVTHYYNEAEDQAYFGQIEWTASYQKNPYDPYAFLLDYPYYGEARTYNRNGVLTRRQTANCIEEYTDWGMLSRLTVSEGGGVSTVYQYYTQRGAYDEFDPTGHLFYVQTTDGSGDKLYHVQWEKDDWYDGSYHCYGYRVLDYVHAESGYEEVISEYVG